MGDSAPSPIPFSQGQASGLSELSGASPMQRNVLPDALGALHVRPGIRQWADFTTAPHTGSVIGMYVWRGNLLFLYEDRSLWAMTAPDSFLDLGITLGGTGKPVWTYDQTRVVVTGGGAPVQWQGAGPAALLAPAATDPSGAQLALTHIQYSAQRFIGNINDNSGILQWTPPGPGSHTSWPIVGPYYAEAEANPDPVVATWANVNEVFAFGTRSMQVYVPDPAVGFSVASSLQVGCIAPYSVIVLEDGTVAWLDDNHRLVLSGGRDSQVLSEPSMSTTIRELGTVTDCWGCNIMIGTWDLLVWSFPTAERTVYYDRTTKKWGEFDSLDSNGESVGWLPTSYMFWPDKNIHLVGLADGTIGELTFSASTDKGQTLRGLSRTGFIDAGTFNRKTCKRVDFQLRRDQAVGITPTDPRVEYRYRDSLGTWSLPDYLALGGSYQPVVTKWAKGQFRQRQHEITFSNASDFVLAGATQTLETMES